MLKAHFGVPQPTQKKVIRSDQLILAGLNPLTSPIPTRKDKFIDTILISNPLVPIVSDCTDRLDIITHPDLESDHIPIGCTIPTAPTVNNRLVWNLKNADWDSYRKTLHTSLHNWKPTESPTKMALQLTFFINHAALKHVGKRPLSVFRKKSWWSKRLQRLKDCFKAAKKRHARQQTSFSARHLASQKRDYLSAVETAKDKFWNNTVQRLNSGGDKEFYRLYRRTTSPSRPVFPPILDPQTDCYVSGNNAATTFANTFASAAMKPNINPHILQMVNTTQEEICCDDSHSPFPATVFTIANIVKNLGVNKAFGPDDIHTRFIKEGGPPLITAIYCLLKCSWDNRCFPTNWKLGYISPIPKTQKPTSDPKDYRPIALLNIIGKIYEKILTNALTQFTENKGFISPLQAGFQPMRDCQEQILRLHEDILTSFEYRGATDAIFLDISKAYDSVWHEGLIHKLRDLGVQGNLIHILVDFLYDRRYMVRTQSGSSSWTNFSQGVLQGSPISPLLFIIFINDLTDLLNSLPLVKISLFADDVALWTSPPPINSTTAQAKHHYFQARSQLRTALNLVQLWSDNWRMTFSHSKTKHVHFTHAKIGPPPST